ncbi:hypothetical protein C0075_02120 [Rhizobium sp. KAs_5_22]|uniref:hypothetical protein n=1 Tax=Ciceribacter selenitireducens TaxID=448181 RepID=UPI000490BEA8|nr:hypothetical protein [Ciceribacter selenitireducens]PPJ49381.1 hypothetical protein C0075_02120 [Rhizobium sp. KAs_5_22]
MSRVRPAISLFVVMCGLFLAFSIMELRATARFGQLMLMARYLETGTPVTRASVTNLAAWADGVVSDDYCRSDIVRAGLTVKLAELDQRNSYYDYDAWAEGLAATERYIRHAIGCTPTDGNFWLRLAMVRRAIAERPEEIAFLMQQSVNYAPAEQAVLAARFIVWNAAGERTLQAARAAVDTDVQTLLRYGDVRLIRQIVQKPGEALLPYLRSATTSLPAERQGELSGAKIAF